MPRCLFFTRDSDDYVKNPCVFTWFVKVMVFTMVLELFSIGSPMDFHGEIFCGSRFSSQKPPVAPRRSLKAPAWKSIGNVKENQLKTMVKTMTFTNHVKTLGFLT